MIPLLGFAPDVDATIPGVLTDCSNVIPYEAGIRSAPAPISVGADALAAACRGATVLTDLSAARKVYAGTSAGLYELSSTTWTDRSKVGGYSLGSDDRWSFTQFRGSSIAATPSVGLQRATTAAFATVAGAPQARIVDSASGFVMALNTSSFTDEWYCSALNDETDWTTSVSTQCTKGRIDGGFGPINAGKRFGADIVAYKSSSLFVGRYVGSPVVWQWTQISNDIGCVGQDAVVDTTIGHVFVGRDGIYLFDGTTPRPVAGFELVRKWFVADLSGSYSYRTKLLWDPSNHLVWIYYPSSGSTGDVDRCLVYHVHKAQWGLAHSTIEAALNYTTPAATYGSGFTGFTTYASLPEISYDSPFWLSGQTNPAVVNTDHKIATLSGTQSSSYFITGDVGDDEGARDVMAVRVRYLQSPTTSTATGYYKEAEGDSLTTGPNATMSDGKHDIRQSGRWHRFKVAQTGDWKATSLRPQFLQGGSR